MYQVIHESKYSEKVREAIPELKKVLGKRLSVDVADRIAYCKDYNPLHLHHLLNGKIPALPDAVVFPASVEEVAEVIRIANSYSVPLYVFGGGSGVIDGSTPYCGGIVLSTLSLDEISIDEERMQVKAGAGVVGGKLEYVLNHKGYTLRHSPQSLYCSTVGGWVATRASGQFSTRYGNIEDIIVSLTVVTPSGEVIEAKNLPRKASIDIKSIYIGSEGLFGVICDATLRMRKLPEKQYKMAFRYDSMDDAVEDARNLMQSLKPALLRIFDKLETMKNFSIDGVVTIVMVEGENAEREMEFIETKLKGEKLGEKPVEIWLEERFNVSDISRFVPMGIIFDTIEVSCFWKNAMDVYRSILKAIRGVEGTLLASCHASHFYEDGLCFYFTFAGVSGDYEGYYRSVWEAAMKTALLKGASLSHHHGIGGLRAKWLKEEFLGFYSIFRDLKMFFDSKNIMNRGTVLGNECRKGD
jgi:alkyldihydroxyacetonephosphate synthase